MIFFVEFWGIFLPPFTANVSKQPYATSGLKLNKQTSLSSVRGQFMWMRCINAWNYLSEEARSSTSVSAFKKSLFTYNLKNLYPFYYRFINSGHASLFLLL